VETAAGEKNQQSAMVTGFRSQVVSFVVSMESKTVVGFRTQVVAGFRIPVSGLQVHFSNLRFKMQCAPPYPCGSVVQKNSKIINQLTGKKSAIAKSAIL
jgi:hypothetical protein